MDPVRNPSLLVHARILDTHGRQVANIPIQTSPGQNIWDTRNVPAGVYSVELINNTERLAVERLVVQH